MFFLHIKFDFIKPLAQSMPHKLWIIKTTLPDSWREFEVTSFAQSLVEKGAACVQHHKVSSTYKWEGKIQSENEWALQIKVSGTNKQAVIDQMSEMHPYDVPQIVMHECEASQDYGEWVNSQ